MSDDDAVRTTVPLPVDVYDALGGDEEAVAETLAMLAAERARLQRSVAHFTDRGDGPPAWDDAEMGVAGMAEMPPPIGVLLGFEFESAGHGQATMAFEPGPEHANPMGTLHGGVVCDVGDAAMGTAYATTLDAGDSFTTLELDVKYLRPVWDRRLTATATVVNDGRTVGLVECDVTGPDGELVARLQSVCMTLRGDRAAGR